jgi:broad specificity phosphatase PhoE
MIKKMKRVIWVVICSTIVGGWASTTVRSGMQSELSGKALVEALRRGGFNIYFRHTATDWSTDDRVVNDGDWESCDARQMRQLSERGREQAQRIGEVIRRLQIPVGRVFSSEYCRTRQTAQLMNLGRVETTRAIMNMRAASFVGGTDKLVKRARQLLSIPPPEGTNAVFVAHGNLMRAVSGAYTGEAGAVVLAPQGEGRMANVAVLDLEHWEILASRFCLKEQCVAPTP